MHLSVCVFYFMYACPQNAKEGIESTGEGIISGWEPTNLETRNRPHSLEE